MAADKPTVTTFSPVLARQMARYIKEILGTTERALNPINGRYLADKFAFAKVTTSVADGATTKYAWKEQRWKLSTKDFEDAPDGRSGTTTANYIVSKTTLTTTDVVLIKLQEDWQTRNNVWIPMVSAKLPRGQYQGMSYMDITQNQTGFSYLFAHELL